MASGLDWNQEIDDENGKKEIDFFLFSLSKKREKYFLIFYWNLKPKKYYMEKGAMMTTKREREAGTVKNVDAARKQIFYLKMNNKWIL